MQLMLLIILQSAQIWAFVIEILAVASVAQASLDLLVRPHCLVVAKAALAMGHATLWSKLECSTMATGSTALLHTLRPGTQIKFMAVFVIQGGKATIVPNGSVSEEMTLVQLAAQAKLPHCIVCAQQPALEHSACAIRPKQHHPFYGALQAPPLPKYSCHSAISMEMQKFLARPLLFKSLWWVGRQCALQQGQPRRSFLAGMQGISRHSASTLQIPPSLQLFISSLIKP